MSKSLLLIFFLIILPIDAMAITILIDPGHGGEDEGASNTIWVSKTKKKVIYEKDIALQLSKRIHKKLKKLKFNSYLSRSLDRTVTLEERAKLAEKIKADLFISIHINSSTEKDPRGFETYYLDNHQDAAMKKVEEVENKNLKGEALVIQQILLDLIIERTVKTSKGLAGYVHNEIYKSTGRQFKMVNRGIKPGLFYVLALAKRPAILLEVGFLSNEKELKRILNPGFQEKYANAVVKGIDLYYKKYIKPAKSTTLF